MKKCTAILTILLLLAMTLPAMAASAVNRDGYYKGIKRYFTPTTEVPICGHATIAAHYVRAIEEQLSTSCWVQKTKAEILPIDIEKDETGDYTIVMTQGKPKITAPFAPKIQIFGQAVIVFATEIEV